MKALSVKEPWASMIALGKKTIETRIWATAYRGPLLICGSKKPKGMFSGRMACVADLVDCRPMTTEDEPAALCELYPKAQAWVLANIRAVQPRYVTGQLHLFEVDDEKVKVVE